jgi:hypothetical protein
MTQGEIEVELTGLREQVLKLQQRQANQQTMLARWAIAFLGAFFLLQIFNFFVFSKADAGLSVSATTFMFVAMAFGSLSQPGGSVWTRLK